MANTGFHNIDKAVQKTNIWLKEAMDELHEEDKSRAYHALRSVMHAVRDSLDPGEAADFASQLPMVLRGVYYEGWNPRSKSRLHRSQDSFFGAITDEVPESPISPERYTKMFFRLCEKHMSGGLLDHVKVQLPEEIREILD